MLTSRDQDGLCDPSRSSRRFLYVLAPHARRQWQSPSRSGSVPARPRRLKSRPAPKPRAAAAEEEPPALNPFGPVKTEREDAIPGYLETSDGKVYFGNVYMTRDKRLKLLDAQLERQREIPLRVVKQIECKVEKEWMEKEWRFKEAALDEKMYTGRTLSVAGLHPHGHAPGRPQDHRPAGRDHLRPADLRVVRHGEPGPFVGLQAERFMLHKRDKGDIGTDLKSLRYVKLVKLGPDALEEGKRKAAKARRGKPRSTVL